MGKGKDYLETAWELGKDVAAAAIDAASILTPLVPKEAAEWGWDRLNYDGWFDEDDGKTSNEQMIGVLSGFAELLAGGGALMAGAAMTGGPGSPADALFAAGAYALIEGMGRLAFDDDLGYTSGLPVTLVSYAAQGVKKAAQGIGKHVSKRYGEVVERHDYPTAGGGSDAERWTGNPG